MLRCTFLTFGPSVPLQYSGISLSLQSRYVRQTEKTEMEVKKEVNSLRSLKLKRKLKRTIPKVLPTFNAVVRTAYIQRYRPASLLA